MESSNQALTIKEVAKFLNISNQMVYNLIKSRDLKAFKIGSALRILYSDLMEYIETQKSEFENESPGPADEPAVVNYDKHLFLIEDVSTRIGSFAMSNITIKLPVGKVLAVVGSSGSGKSLLLRAIAGLQEIEDGAIYFGRMRIDTLKPAERYVGFVFQDFVLLPHYYAKKNVGFPLALKKLDAGVTEILVEDVATEIGLDPQEMDKLPREMSTGMKQLVAIARAKIKNLDLLLMDEPLSSLDARLKDRMRIAIKRIVSNLGKTTIIATNDPVQAMSIADFIAVVHDGRLLQFGERSEVYDNPSSALVLDLVTSGPVNRLPVTVEAGRVLPYGMETDYPDGNYDLHFRSDAAIPDTDGIEMAITKTSFYDGSRSLISCETAGGDTLELILPTVTTDASTLRFSLNKYFLFDRQQ
jgi:excisionase family DNA binding protein